MTRVRLWPTVLALGQQERWCVLVRLSCVAAGDPDEQQQSGNGHDAGDEKEIDPAELFGQHAARRSYNLAPNLYERGEQGVLSRSKCR